MVTRFWLGRTRKVQLLVATAALLPVVLSSSVSAYAERPSGVEVCDNARDDECGPADAKRQSARFWTVTGNLGTHPLTNFVGTIDNQALELKVANERALRLEPTGTGGSPNVIGGVSANQVAPGASSATIGGGGASGLPNRVFASVGTIGGGFNNTVSDAEATISGGSSNTAGGKDDAVGGGVNNVGRGLASTIPGGDSNSALGDWSFATGRGNSSSGVAATVSGGQNNMASGANATVGGGMNNVASGFLATIAGGDGNVASAPEGNTPGKPGGFATVGGGRFNTASGTSATVSGGVANAASGALDTVAGGGANTASGGQSTVGGGFHNLAGPVSTIAGGNTNKATGVGASIGGGGSNIASGRSATIAGGANNTAAGNEATVVGGINNSADGDGSLVAGTQARARHPGTFVWADLNSVDFTSTAANQFSARASGGVRFVSAVDTAGNPVAGVALAPGGGSWSSLSDRAAKTNVVPVNNRLILEQLLTIPVGTWSYTSQDPSIRHIGPMAQDFATTFGVGEDAHYISTVDAEGVALAAIQGLFAVVQEKDSQIVVQEQRINALERRLDALERRLNAQP